MSTAVTGLHYKIVPSWVASSRPMKDESTNNTALHGERPRRASFPAMFDSEVFSINFSADSELLSGTCGDGTVKVWDAATGKERGMVNVGGAEKYPVLCARWRPNQSASSGAAKSVARHVLLAVSGDGHIVHYHAPSNKILSEVWLPDCPLYTCDYASDGTTFGVAGRDQNIHIFDEATKDRLETLEHGNNISTAGHSARIFAMRFHPFNKNLVISAGWDNTVQLFDRRAGKSVRSLANVEVRSEGLDFNNQGDKFLVASLRSRNPLMVVDFNTFQVIDDGFHFGPNKPEQIATNANSSMLETTNSTNSGSLNGRRSMYCNSVQTPLFSARFSRDDNNSFIIVGGGGKGQGVHNQAVLLDYHNIRKQNEALSSNPQTALAYSHQQNIIGSITNLQKSVYSVDIAPDMQKMAAATGEGVVYVMNIQQTTKE